MVFIADQTLYQVVLIVDFCW